ncbi:hypothetical protein [Nonomuraea sp. NPDC049158]|uniref:hypothetical protein n=1 Tax=Nonomuraea sp. NPDC049158 TaxID=3155649 RepID=UPI0033C6DDB7
MLGLSDAGNEVVADLLRPAAPGRVRPEERGEAMPARLIGTQLVEASTETHRWSTRGHTDGVSWPAFRPDGRALATASLDATTRLWDLSVPGRPVPLAALTGHTQNVFRAPE